MTKGQTAKVNMYIAMLLFFAKYELALAAFLQLVTEITNFTGTYNDLQLEIAKQKLKISGVVTAKDSLLETAIKLTVKSARKARAWAVNAGNATLAAQFDVQISTFGDMTQSVVLNSLTNINSSLNTNIASLTGYRVTAANVTAITAAITAASDSIGTPKQAITTRAVATDEIALDITTCDGYLELIDDLLVPEYEDTNPGMVAEYHLSRAVTSLGNHATGLKATVTDAASGALLEGVQVTIVEVSRSGVTDIDGLVVIVRIKPGTYHVTCTMTGFVAYETILVFELGKTQALAVAMVAI
jgi:hypothetical protein